MFSSPRLSLVNHTRHTRAGECVQVQRVCSKHVPTTQLISLNETDLVHIQCFAKWTIQHCVTHTNETVEKLLAKGALDEVTTRLKFRANAFGLGATTLHQTVLPSRNVCRHQQKYSGRPGDTSGGCLEPIAGHIQLVAVFEVVWKKSSCSQDLISLT